MNNIFFDTEFIETGQSILLLSIGMVSSDGREYYAETKLAGEMIATPEAYTHLPWLLENVVPYLSGGDYIKENNQIAKDIFDFAMQGGQRPTFWSYYADYDWVVFCQLYGSMVKLPMPFPQFCMDLQQVRRMGNFKWLPEQKSAKHNALNDAKWHKEMYDYMKDAVSSGKNTLYIT